MPRKLGLALLVTAVLAGIVATYLYVPVPWNYAVAGLLALKLSVYWAVAGKASTIGAGRRGTGARSAPARAESGETGPQV